jgi:mannose-1-phosphate guanylyltransferase
VQNVSSDSPWVILLAAGDGARLRHLTTTNDGVAVPKQFCSLHGGPSLLQESLHRASRIATREHICAVVAEQHGQWWQPQLWSLPHSNIIRQPANRGTAWGILLPLLHVLERDPTATVVLLPCDHYVHDEPVLIGAIRAALLQVRRSAEHPVLLGMEPDQPDPELGYIVPGISRGAATSVVRFVEKPARLQARLLIEQGALWNAFILVSSGYALLRLIEARISELAMEMQSTVRHVLQGARESGLADLYRRLPQLDFSKYILQTQERALRVLAVPACGWSDLGTPARVGAALDRLSYERRRDARHSTTIHLNLAAQHALRRSFL